MTTRKAALGELESLILLAILRLGDDASAKKIRDEVADPGGRELTRGATYATLNRLERKDFVEVHTKEPDDGGRAKHHFTLTEQGLTTLRTAQTNLARMRAGLESILDAS